MFSADQIADIQGFNKVYQNLMKQMDFRSRIYFDRKGSFI